MTGRSQARSLQSCPRREFNENTQITIDANIDTSLGKAQEPIVYSGFTAINHLQQPDKPIPSVEAEGTNTDCQVDNSHAEKHPIVAQYLGLGREHVDYSSLKLHAALPSAASKQKWQEKALGSLLLGKQPSKRSATAPQRKPAKKSKKSQSADMETTQHGTETTPKALARAEGLQQVENDQEVASDTTADHDSRASPAHTFTLSQQSALRLNAWKYQEPHASFSSIVSQRNGSNSSSNTNPALQMDITTTNNRISFLSSITASPSHGNEIYGDSSRTFANLHANSNVRIEPQLAVSRARPPPSTGHVLETILEESPSSSVNNTRDSNHLPPQSSVTPAIVLTQPSFICAPASNSGLIEGDLFDELDDEDLFELDTPSDPVSLVQQRSLKNYNQLSLRHATLEPPIIEIGSDDEWTVLDDEDETALVGPTNDVMETMITKPQFFPKTVQCTNTNVERISSHCQTNPNQTNKTLSTSQAIACRVNPIPPVLVPPIIRPAFPAQIRDRSPLIGVSSSLTLRTCFRIGECLNVGCTAARSSKTQSSDSILIELYAKVMSSHRDVGGTGIVGSVTQHFVLADLFHDQRGPYLQGRCDTWRGCELWDYDCSRFLGDAGDGKRKICRAVGRMKRDKVKGWVFIILNVWEATWDDIESVRGIICG